MNNRRNVSRGPRKNDPTPPHNLEFERGLLAACLFDLSAVDRIQQLRPRDFYDDHHAELFELLFALRDQGKDVADPKVIIAESSWTTRDLGRLARDGGFPSSVEYYAAEIAKCRRLRELHDVGYRLLALEQTDDPDQARQWMNDIQGEVPPGPKSAEITPYAPFPVGTLPEPLRGFVVASSAAIGCDPAYVALPMLSMVGSAIGMTREIRLKRSWTEPPIIWTAIIGESGTLKTPAFSLALRPVRELQSEALREHDDAMAEHELATEEYQRALAKWRNDHLGERPTKPEPPQAARYIVSDVTVEGLAPILRANPRGVLLERDELSGWLGSFDRYASNGGADAAHWLSMHTGQSMLVDRRHGGTIHVPRAAVSITGGIQPGILEMALGERHLQSGLAARLLMAFPPRSPKKWRDADITQETLDGILHVLEELRKLESRYIDGVQAVPVPVDLSPEARRAWISFYDCWAAEQATADGPLAAAYSKLEAYAARLALVIHLVRWANGERVDPNQVDSASIAGGAELVRWFGREARRVYGIFVETDEERETRELVEWIALKGGRVTVRELTQGPRRYRKNSAAAENDLMRLVKQGLARWEHQKNKTGPPSRYLVLETPGDVATGYTFAEIPGKTENV